MERRDEHAPVAQQHRLAVELGQHLDVRADVADTRSADEDAAERLVLACDLEVGLEARDLPAVGVPVDHDVGETEMARSSRIMPAQVPKIGRSNERIASSSPYSVASFVIVVDSPPGITSPSSPSSCSGSRTSTTSAPSPEARACSRNAPCSARTPIRGRRPSVQV